MTAQICVPVVIREHVHIDNYRYRCNCVNFNDRAAAESPSYTHAHCYYQGVMNALDSCVANRPATIAVSLDWALL